MKGLADIFWLQGLGLDIGGLSTLPMFLLPHSGASPELLDCVMTTN